MRISDWSSDVCSSDLLGIIAGAVVALTLWQMVHNGADFSTALRQASFAFVSIITCTGFTSPDYAQWGGFPEQIGRAHVSTPVTNAQLVCRLLLEQKKHRAVGTDAVRNPKCTRRKLSHHL